MKGTLILAVVLGTAAGVGGRFVLRQDNVSVPDSAEVKRVAAYQPNTVAANGIVEGARPEIDLRPEISGHLLAIYVRENAQVAQGTLLAELDNDLQKQQVTLAQAEVALAQAELNKVINGERQEKRAAQAAIEKAKQIVYRQAKADYERSRRMMATRAISEEALETHFYTMLRTEAEWKQAQAELALIEAPARVEDVEAGRAKLAAAEARLRVSQAELAKTRLVAPSAGRILQVFDEPGEIAGPHSTQPVIRMADLAKRRVRVFVEELDIARVQVGQKVIITADGMPGKEFAGTVGEVHPRMGKRAPQSDNPGEYKDLYFREVLIDLVAGDDLPTNLRVQAKIHVSAEETHP